MVWQYTNHDLDIPRRRSIHHLVPDRPHGRRQPGPADHGAQREELYVYVYIYIYICISILYCIMLCYL